MNKLPKPLGARILVEEIITSLSIRERGKRAGLTVITNEDDKHTSNCSMGLVLATGTDPFVEENGVKVGKVVYFSRHAGMETWLEGKRYRTLDFTELTSVLDEMPSDGRLLSQLPDTEV